MNEIAFPSGVFGELSREILKNTPCKSQRFAIATALSVIATVAQRQFRSPDGYGVLASYQFIVGHTGCGKSQYIDQFHRLIKLVDKNLVINHFDSVEMLQCILRENAGGTLVQDHSDHWLQSFFDSKRIKKQWIRMQLVTLWNNEQNNDVLSIIGAVSDTCYKKILNRSPSSLYDSLLARTDFVIEKTVMRDFEEDFARFETPEHIVELLKEIAKTNFQILVGWEPGVRNAWDDFARQCLKRENDKNPSAWSHMPEKVLRTASLLAVVANPAQPVITLNEMQWAIAWHESLVS